MSVRLGSYCTDRGQTVTGWGDRAGGSVRGERETEDNFPVDIAILQAPLKHLLSLLHRERERKKEKAHESSLLCQAVPSLLLPWSPARHWCQSWLTDLAGRSQFAHAPPGGRGEARGSVAWSITVCVVSQATPSIPSSFPLDTGIPRRDQQNPLGN